MLYHFNRKFAHNLYLIKMFCLHQYFLQNYLYNLTVERFQISVDFYYLRNLIFLINFVALFLVLNTRKDCYFLIFYIHLVLLV